MAGPLRKVQPGEKLRISASAWNAFVDVANAWKGNLFGGGAGGNVERARDHVLVLNDSGADLAQGNVLGIDEPVILPSVNEDEFAYRLALSGIAPVAGTHEGKFAVLLEPIADGAIGRACVSGVCPARIDMTDAAHGFAEIGDLDTAHLVSGESGSAVILWSEPFGSIGPGEKWAVVRLGAASGVFPLRAKWFLDDISADPPVWQNMTEFLCTSGGGAYLFSSHGITSDRAGKLKGLTLLWWDLVGSSGIGPLSFQVRNITQASVLNSPGITNLADNTLGRGNHAIGLAVAAGDELRLQMKATAATTLFTVIASAGFWIDT